MRKLATLQKTQLWELFVNSTFYNYRFVYNQHQDLEQNIHFTPKLGLDESPAVMVQPLILVALLRIFKFPTNTANILLLTAAD